MSKQPVQPLSMPMKTNKQTLLYVAMALCAIETTPALKGASKILNPATYVSPNGDYSLSVNPSDLYGRGPGEYRFARNGETIWTNQLP